MSADMLLLAGTCIVEEAVLTGESTPQWKQPVPAAAAAGQPGNGLAPPSDRLSIKRDKAHVLFGGTKILQHTGDKEARIRTPDGGCLAVVLRTGFETSQGGLLADRCRSLFPPRLLLDGSALLLWCALTLRIPGWVADRLSGRVSSVLRQQPTQMPLPAGSSGASETARAC